MEKAEKRVNEFHEFQKLGLICNNGDYIPAGIHYPQITQYPAIDHDEMYKGYTFPADGMIDVYVHFPFCSKRCADVDLNRWLSGVYKIETDESPTDLPTNDEE